LHPIKFQKFSIQGIRPNQPPDLTNFASCATLVPFLTKLPYLKRHRIGHMETKVMLFKMVPFCKYSPSFKMASF